MKIFSMKALKAIFVANKEIDDMKSTLGMIWNSNSAICNVHFSRYCQMATTLVTDWQLGLLETFCCYETPIVFRSRYDVTPTALQHPMLLHDHTLVSHHS